ncbi:hypothetical protein [Occallatibacter riparius]|uniref:Uncharacterized protein n=1 Tax=Occallatibacter riparius TaxID=1002689 RepID=A0A9J7BNT4_9BACT|nr:hypothetical protein [Occallatibacter riparius]UWZ84384.1 hypothetical protein MOP44_00270 [Occallatibacter riparius]
MFIFESKNRKMRADTDACYEAVASQEEAYLENAEEDLRMILEADDPAPHSGAEPDQQRENAVEELITGDSDDPPLSEDSVAEMLRPLL